MIIYILSVFPDMFSSVFSKSIIGRAIDKGLLRIHCVNIRDFSDSKHHNTDDYPYGGGSGMLMMAQPIASAIKYVRSQSKNGDLPVIYMSPKGRRFSQTAARQMSMMDEFILLCGHYEGIDQRIIDKYVTEEISIGDYILTGGEVAAMVIVDTVSRLIPGVLGNNESPEFETFSESMDLEYPQYTRPRVFEDMAVPDVLLNGNHAQIMEWRKKESEKLTLQRRPDLFSSRHSTTGGTAYDDQGKD